MSVANATDILIIVKSNIKNNDSFILSNVYYPKLKKIHEEIKKEYEEYCNKIYEPTTENK